MFVEDATGHETPSYVKYVEKDEFSINPGSSGARIIGNIFINSVVMRVALLRVVMRVALWRV